MDSYALTSTKQKNQSTALLSCSDDSSSSSNPSRKPFTKIHFIAFLLIFCIALSAAAAFAFLVSSSSSPSSSAHFSIKTTARPHKKLNKPVVIMVSCDGFRFGYQFKTPTPNIHRLIKHGTEAETGLIPVFPSYTFPNHYSIVTGLYPASHGIINNRFVDPVTGEKFTQASHEPKWWLGEPLWETVVNQGLKAAAYFWAGSEVHKGAWDCPKGYCFKYNSSVPFEERVDTVLSYFDLPPAEIPVFTALYFEDPDSQGHRVGPDDGEVTEAVGRIDKMIGRLIDGLEKRGVFEEVTFIMVGDHGMVGTCESKVIFLEDLADWIEIPAEWVHSYYPLLAIWPPVGANGTAMSKIVERINQGLESGKIKNGKHLKVYLKENLPSRFLYSGSDRIPPILGLMDEGFRVDQKRIEGQEYCGGAHGYDNEIMSMRTIFIGHGPRFARGKKVPSFQNIQIYNVITSILGIQGAPNNGSASFPSSLLRPAK